MALENENTELNMYADDNTLAASAKTLTLVEQKLSSDTAKVEDWCDKNKMAINADKTKLNVCYLQQHKESIDLMLRKLI